MDEKNDIQFEYYFERIHYQKASATHLLDHVQDSAWRSKSNQV